MKFFTISWLTIYKKKWVPVSFNKICTLFSVKLMDCYSHEYSCCIWWAFYTMLSRSCTRCIYGIVGMKSESVILGLHLFVRNESFIIFEMYRTCMAGKNREAITWSCKQFCAVYRASRTLESPKAVHFASSVLCTFNIHILQYIHETMLLWSCGSIYFCEI